MTVECPGCQTRFPVDARKVPEGGIHARCSVCSEVFLVEVSSSDPETTPSPAPELEPEVVDSGLPEAEVLEEETAAGPEEPESGFETVEPEGEAGDELEPSFEMAGSELETEGEAESAFESPEPLVDVPDAMFESLDAEIEEEEGEPSDGIEMAFQEAGMEEEEEPGPPFGVPEPFEAPEPTVHAPESTFEDFDTEVEEEEPVFEPSDEMRTDSQEAVAEAEPEPPYKTAEPDSETPGTTFEAPESEVEEETEEEELPPPFELPPVAVEEPGPYTPPVEPDAVEEEETPIHLMEMEAGDTSFEMSGTEEEVGEAGDTSFGMSGTEEEVGEAGDATFDMPDLEVEERTFGAGIPTFGDGEATFSMDSPAIDTPLEESDDELIPTFGDRAIDLPGFETRELPPSEADSGESVEEEPDFGEPPAEAEEVEAGRDSAPAGPEMPETPVEAPPPPAEQSAVYEGEVAPEVQPQGFESPEQEEEIAASFEVPDPSMPTPEVPETPTPEAASPPSPGAPPTATPEEKPLPTPHFGRRDPKEKAQRLARVLVSDIILYNPDRHQRALEQGSLKEEFDDEIQKSWNEYVDQVGDDIANSTNYFNEALNEILCKGQQLF